MAKILLRLSATVKLKKGFKLMQWFSFDYILDQSEIDIKVSVEKFLLDSYNTSFWGFNKALLKNEAFSSKRSKFKKRSKKIG